MNAYLLLTTTLAMASPSLAPADSAPFTWDELRRTAKERNPSLASSEKGLEAKQAAVKGSYGPFLPKLSLSADRTRSITEALTSGTESRTTGYRYGATASLNIFNGFASRAGLKSAKASEAEAEASLRVTSASLRHELRLAAFSVYLQQERVRLGEKSLKRQQQNQKVMELKYGSGSEARWNVSKTKAEVGKAEYALGSAKSRLDTAREELAALLQLETLPERPMAAPEAAALSDPSGDFEASLEEHPELQRGRHAEERSAQGIVAARSGFFPSIDLSYSRARNTSRPDGGGTTRTNSSAFAISADWNIFNGATDYYKAQEAGATHEAALLTLESTRRKLRAELRSKLATYRSSLAQLPVTRAVREAAEERERIVTRQYRAGLKSYLDWEQAESQLLTAEQSELNALGESLTAFAALERARGLGLEQE